MTPEQKKRVAAALTGARRARRALDDALKGVVNANEPLAALRHLLTEIEQIANRAA